MTEEQHHWEGLVPDPEKYFGFIYTITSLDTGHSYVGKRQYHKAKQKIKGCKSKVFDRSSDKWKCHCWNENEWQTYSGSSKYLTKFMKENPEYIFKHEILKNCTSRAELVFHEAREQWKRDVLTAELPDGSPMYFNHCIAGIRFRPKKKPTTKEEEVTPIEEI